MLTRISRRAYTSSRQIGRCIQVSDNNKLLIPAGKQSILYTLHMNQTIANWKQSVIDNSHKMIRSFDVVKAEEDKTVAELLKEGQFDIKVNSEKYTIYPDYTHLTNGDHEHATHRTPFVKGMISDQLKNSMLEENKGS
jgi:hypothetical protein